MKQQPTNAKKPLTKKQEEKLKAKQAKQAKRAEKIRILRRRRYEALMLPVFTSSIKRALKLNYKIPFATYLEVSDIVRVPLKKDGKILVLDRDAQVSPFVIENIDELLKMARIEIGLMKKGGGIL